MNSGSLLREICDARKSGSARGSINRLYLLMLQLLKTWDTGSTLMPRHQSGFWINVSEKCIGGRFRKNIYSKGVNSVNVLGFSCVCIERCRIIKVLKAQIF